MKMIRRFIRSQQNKGLRGLTALRSKVPIRIVWSTGMAEPFIVQCQIQIFTTGIDIMKLKVNIFVEYDLG